MTEPIPGPPAGGQVPMPMQIELPPEIAGGVPADFASIWNSESMFVLDFATMSAPPHQMQDEDGNQFVGVSARINARVRIPPEQVFELAKALTRQLDMWEQAKGQRPPSDPGLPSMDV